MRVEIWSDAVCPWCYIGGRRFQKARAAQARVEEVARGEGLEYRLADRRHGVAGAQPPGVLRQMLRTAWDDAPGVE